MIQDLFLSLLEISLAAGIVTVIVALLSPLLNRRYSLRWKYFIWLGLAVRLLLPFNLELPARQLRFTIPEIRLQTPAAVPAADGGTIPFLLQTQNGTQVSLTGILSILWLLGALLFFCAHLAVFLHYKRRIIRNSNPAQDCGLLAQIRTVSDELRLRANFGVLICNAVSSPMIIGLFRPFLVLPEKRYSGDELYFILKHELIHLKRRDILYKFLMVAANAAHWFNPAIYLMRKEASLDLELFCDEEVVKGAGIGVRKAYTETLLSTLDRQNKKNTGLSTQFYGGTSIMKKRFQTILTRNKKKNGFAACVVTILLTLSLGTLIACSSNENNIPAPSSNTEQNSPSEPASEPGVSQPDGQIQTSDAAGATTEAVPENAGQDGTEVTLSADAQAVQEIAQGFLNAYFNADTDSLKDYLIEPYGWDIEVYDGNAVEISSLSLKGLAEIPEMEVGAACVVSAEFKRTAQDDSYRYLTIELIKETAGWKISFYGLEM